MSRSTIRSGTLKVIGSVSRSPVVVKKAPLRIRNQWSPVPIGPGLVRLAGAWIQPWKDPPSVWSVMNQYLASLAGGTVGLPGK